MTNLKWSMIITASETLDNDKYNEHGKNISSQNRRQKLEKWTVVARKSHNLYTK